MGISIGYERAVTVRVALLVLVGTVVSSAWLATGARTHVGASLLRVVGPGAAVGAGAGPAVDVRLSTDGPTVGEMVTVVREQAARVPGAEAQAPLHLVLTRDLAQQTGDDRALLAGLQRGATAWVRTDLAWPERTLLHEVAHVLTLGDDHGHLWRAVYLGAVEELYGADAADRELRRVAWIYDRCYRTDSCPGRLPP